MLPLPSLPTRGYVLFWITVLALALAVLFVIRRL
jgi:hypothetical protein